MNADSFAAIVRPVNLVPVTDSARPSSVQIVEVESC